MTLPAGSLARETVTVNGQPLEIRSLSRHETIEMGKFKDDPDEGEVFLIAKATGEPEAAVREFRDSTGPLELDSLLDAILRLSGLDVLAAKAAQNGGPKA